MQLLIYSVVKSSKSACAKFAVFAIEAAFENDANLKTLKAFELFQLKLPETPSQIRQCLKDKSSSNIRYGVIGHVTYLVASAPMAVRYGFSFWCNFCSFLHFAFASFSGWVSHSKEMCKNKAWFQSPAVLQKIIYWKNNFHL